MEYFQRRIKDSDDEENEEAKFKDNKEYLIRVYGVTEKGTSISVNIFWICTSFYEYTEGWTKIHLSKFINFIKGKLSNYYKDSQIQTDFKIRKKFWGFTNNKKI